MSESKEAVGNSKGDTNVGKTGALSSRFVVEKVESAGVPNERLAGKPDANDTNSSNLNSAKAEQQQQQQQSNRRPIQPPAVKPRQEHDATKSKSSPKNCENSRTRHVSYSDGTVDNVSSGGATSSVMGNVTPKSPHTFTFSGTLRGSRQQNTYDTLPRVDHYRNLFSYVIGNKKSRPTLEQLHEAQEDGLTTVLVESPKKEVKGPTKKAVKFGWITGVLVRCLLNIWGVMLFLRLSWVVGQTGLGLFTVVILLSTVVTILTALSMSAICTNGEVKGGGAYYMISRSLGPEFGGAIGIIFSLANAVAVAMYIVGFAETVRDVMKEYGLQIVDELNDVRIIGCITLVVLLGVAMVGMEWEARAQLILLGILVVAILDFVVGLFLKVTEAKGVKGYTGYSAGTFLENLHPEFREGHGFFSVFSIFFPAATGILAGANISGDLADAQSAIPKGTLRAILLTTATYLVMGWMVGSTVIRDANGSTEDYYNATVNFTCSAPDASPCRYGLLNDVHVMELISGFAPLILAGIFAATLSSALASLVGAPKVFQAVCKDNLFPGIHVFAVGSGNNDEPKRAYLLTFVIAIGCILIAELNVIAPIISNFFLMAYTLINYSCFDASFSNSPGFRPPYQYYNMWLLPLTNLYFLRDCKVHFGCSKPDVNWGSSTQANVYRSALIALLKLNNVEDHVKNYRPQCLVLSGDPRSRPALVDLVSSFTKKVSLMVCGHLVLYVRLDERPSCFSDAFDLNLSVGILCVQGGLDCSDMLELPASASVPVLQKLENEYECVVEDTDDEDEEDEESSCDEQETCFNTEEIFHSCEDLPSENSAEVKSLVDRRPAPLVQPQQAIIDGAVGTATTRVRVVGRLPINRAKLRSSNQFHRKQKKGFIDVWWLADDGGLTLLIPFLISQSSLWQGCKLRVFFLKGKEDLDKEQRNMAALLSKFRIDYSQMTVVDSHTEAPSAESVTEFQELIEPWRVRAGGTGAAKTSSGITDSELLALKARTVRHVRLRELLHEHSQDASLVVITLPIPRKVICSPYLYMAWLETLTRGMPPVLLLRGNQTSVLTFYS
ncbi:PREDICTED: solute carrier family 12 member 2-like [Priapulus caudatus]|uniref:Solute carrier family 12 member 2-like n=1 Tax=Priapulus caudatus TaxID=37621 RepID=A0ABM1E585_PRICU|nr:PREDICTED: solute carrier family 12 member 2-like [Priapulus caudatus]